MRTIDADALKEDIKNSWHWETVDNITATTVLKQTLSDIDNQPTVEDRPTVYVVPQECIKVLADTVADVIQKIDWNSLIKIVAEKEAGHNCNEDYADCDQFVCSECGIELQDWHRVEREDDGDIIYHEYTFKYCPNCGADMRGCGAEK